MRIEVHRVTDSSFAAPLEAVDRAVSLASRIDRAPLDVRAEVARPCARLYSARAHGGVAGYLLAWLVADELEIHDVATSPDFRRRGVARGLVSAALSAAAADGARTAHLEVRETNEPARKLYEAHGFAPVGRRRGYYADGEDAILMWIALPEG